MVIEKRETCPKCGREHITYGTLVPVDEQLYYPATCDDCGCTFKEWHSIKYIESITDDNLDDDNFDGE